MGNLLSYTILFMPRFRCGFMHLYGKWHIFTREIHTCEDWNLYWAIFLVSILSSLRRICVCVCVCVRACVSTHSCSPSFNTAFLCRANMCLVHLTYLYYLKLQWAYKYVRLHARAHSPSCWTNCRLSQTHVLKSFELCCYYMVLFFALMRWLYRKF